MTILKRIATAAVVAAAAVGLLATGSAGATVATITGTAVCTNPDTGGWRIDGTVSNNEQYDLRGVTVRANGYGPILQGQYIAAGSALSFSTMNLTHNQVTVSVTGKFDNGHKDTWTATFARPEGCAPTPSTTTEPPVVTDPPATDPPVVTDPPDTEPPAVPPPPPPPRPSEPPVSSEPPTTTPGSTPTTSPTTTPPTTQPGSPGSPTTSTPSLPGSPTTPPPSAGSPPPSSDLPDTGNDAVKVAGWAGCILISGWFAFQLSKLPSTRRR